MCVFTRVYMHAWAGKFGRVGALGQTCEFGVFRCTCEYVCVHMRCTCRCAWHMGWHAIQRVQGGTSAHIPFSCACCSMWAWCSRASSCSRPASRRRDASEDTSSSAASGRRACIQCLASVPGCKFMHRRVGGCKFMHRRVGGCKFMHRRACGWLQVHAQACGWLQVHAQACGWLQVHAQACGWLQVHAGVWVAARSCTGVWVAASSCRRVGGCACTHTVASCRGTDAQPLRCARALASLTVCFQGCWTPLRRFTAFFSLQPVMQKRECLRAHALLHWCTVLRCTPLIKCLHIYMDGRHTWDIHLDAPPVLSTSSCEGYALASLCPRAHDGHMLTDQGLHVAADLQQCPRKPCC